MLLFFDLFEYRRRHMTRTRDRVIKTARTVKLEPPQVAGVEAFLHFAPF
jgi:hypothetical protein